MPGLGYYSAACRQVWPGGRFCHRTVLVRRLAHVVGDTLDQLGRGVVLEVGGGTGALAADLLEALQARPPGRQFRRWNRALTA